jgi:hypothetical protein
MCICYHGTDGPTAETIRQEGFQKYTYFARHLEDALGFGGLVIFEVAFVTSEIEQFGWQFKAAERVMPDRIVRVTSYERALVYEDEALGKCIFESNREPGDGTGDPTDVD